MTRSFARALVLFAGLICAATAQAQSYTYSIYIDADNNSATGCTVGSPGGALPGIESVLAISVTAGIPPTVNSVTRSSCSGGVMGAPVAEGTGAVSVGAGIGGTTSIEVSDALINVAPPSVTALRLYAAAQSALGSDVLLTTNGQAGGAPIVLLLPPNGSAIPTPMIGIPALLLLVAILLALGSRAIRQRMIKRLILGLVLLSGVAGAAIFNWTGFPPLATDPAGDSTSGESAIDLRYFFAASGAPNVFFRLDVTGNLAPTLPTVTAVSPSAGPIAGSTVVTITGTNFTGATAVKFGATSALSFIVNNPTTITATAPAGSAGTVDVTVTTPSGTSPTGAADQYTYAAVPTVTVISPTAGPTAGSTVVTITGTNFIGATAVKFGVTAASTFTVSNATTIMATAPAGSGTVDITVTTPGGTSATSAADQYTYVAAPTVTVVSPTSGPTAGGTVVTISGTNFTGATAVKFGAIAATTFTVNNPLSITATAPAGSAGTVDITVTTVGGTSATSAADQFSYIPPPTINKAFGAASVALNGTTTLTFTLTNPAANTGAENGVAFNDTLTNGLQVASTPGISNTCGGTVTAAANSASISLTGGSIALGTTCTIVVNVTGTQAGTVSNTTGAVSSTNGGTGATSNTATLNVVTSATVTKTFAPTKIALNGTTLLTINITNPNGISLTGLAFTDSLPAGLIVASTPNLNNTCGGTATATAGSGTESLSGGTLAASASCAVSVNVQGTTTGDKNNSVQVSSVEGGTSATANATVTVLAPPTISKAFGAGSIALNGTTTVTFTISNSNNPGTPANGDLTGIAFSDTLPVSGGAGSATLMVAATPGVSNTCGGTVTATAGTGVISLSGASVAHNASCMLTINVTGTVAGDASNTTGAISSTEGGTGTSSNTATIKVVAPPTISKAFGAANISLNGTTTLTFTITNPAANTTSENGIAFSDTLTNGLQVASTPGVTTTCGGTVTATANSTSISLTGGSIATPGTTCTIVVNVTGTQAGAVTNTTGAVSSTNGGTGATSNTATLNVVTAATVTKTFAPTKIPLNGTTLLTISITNPDSISLTGLAFTDSLPSGLVVAATPNLNNTCGGTSTATAGSGTVSLSGGSLAASAFCTVSVNVQGTTTGDKLNSVQVSSVEGGTSATASATVTVLSPPTIGKAFGAGSVALNGTTTVTFTISNPNNPGAPANGDLTGVAFSDTLPVSGGAGSATLVVAATPGVSNTCGGTVTATAGTGVISLSGASVTHNASCTLTVNVTGTVAGDANNTTGAISSTEGGTGAASNTATIKVVAPPTISKAFGAANIPTNGTTTLTFTITNPAANTTAENGIAFSDTLTNGLQVATTPGVSNTCGGTVTAAANSTSVSLTGGGIATPSTTCTIVVNVTGTQAGTVSNTTGAVSSTNGGTGATSNTATMNVAPPPTISKAFGVTNILLNGTTTLTFTITNPASSTGAQNAIAFSDTLTNGLQVASTPGVSNTCGGTVTAAANSTSISLTGGSIATPGATCTIAVSVTPTVAGTVNNTTGAISSTEGGTGTTSNTATLNVVSFSIARVGGGSFPAATFNVGYPAGNQFTANCTGCTGTIHWAFQSGAQPPGINLTIVAGTLSGIPSATGQFTMTVTATDTGTGLSGSASFPFTIKPNVSADSYSNLVNNTEAVVTGGTTASPATPFVALSGTVVSNDTPANGVTVSTTGTFATTQGGSVTLAADGTFKYTPPLGAASIASDTFTYTATSNTGTVPSIPQYAASTGPATNGPVTVTLNLANRVWYVNPNAGSNGNGQSQSPWSSTANIKQQPTAGGAASGDIVFVYSGTVANLNANIPLLANQTLWGEGVALVVNGITLRNAGTAPTLSATGANVVSVNSGNTIKGVTLSNASNALIAGAPAGLTVDTSTMTPSGSASGFSITGGSGTVAVSNTTMTGTSTGDMVDVNTGTQSWTFTNSPMTQTAGRALNVTNKTQNGMSFDAASTITVSAGTSDGAVTLSTNSGSGNTFAFGKLTLTTSGTARALVLNNTGTVNNTDTTSTLSTADTATVCGGGNCSAAIDATSTTLGLTFQSASVNGTNAHVGTAIALSSISGTLTMNGGSISTNAGRVANIDTGTASVTYAGTISNTASGTGIRVANKTGGTVTFSGATKTLNTGANQAVTLSSNTGATIDFTGGGLAITTTSATGYGASGGGTVDVTGTGNTIVSGTGTALNVANTTIGASNLNFRSISANGGTNGIIVDTTGVTGGLIVTGTTGSVTQDSSGGTIQNLTGVDGTSQGHGVYLNSTSNVSLNHMNIHNNQGDGIHGNAVNVFTLTYTIVNTNGNTTAQLGNFHGEGDVQFVDLTGSASIDHNNFQLANYNTVGVFNESNADVLNRLVVTNNTFGANDTTNGNAGLAVQNQGGTMNVTFNTNTVTGAGADMFVMDMHGVATTDLIMHSNTMNNTHPNIVSGGGGVSLQSGGTGDQVTFTFDVVGNTISGAHGAGFNIGTGVGHNGQNFSGTFDSNTIGVAAVVDSGSTQGQDLSIDLRGSTVSANIMNNQLYQYNPNATGAIQITTDDDGGHQDKVKLTITGNTISNPGSTINVLQGIQLNSGPTSLPTASTSITCLTLWGNSLTGSGKNGGTDIRLRQRADTDVYLIGNGTNYAGAVNDTTAVNTFATAQNGGTPTSSSIVTNSPPHGFHGACPLP